MSKILIFDKGGRNQRISLIKKNKAPKDFFQSIEILILIIYLLQSNIKEIYWYLFLDLLRKFLVYFLK